MFCAQLCPSITVNLSQVYSLEDVKSEFGVLMISMLVFSTLAKCKCDVNVQY